MALSLSAFVLSWVEATWNILVSSGGWMLFGFLLAGVIRVAVPDKFIKALLQRPGLGSVVKASAIGVPLPLCSCSVIPIGTALRNAGASRGATASFMVSTPEIGVDSFLLSYGLLGPVISIARMVSAFCSAVIVGLAIDRWTTGEPEQTELAQSCSECCEESASAHSAVIAQQGKLRAAFRFGFVELVDDIAAVLVLGFLGAGLISVLVPADLLAGQRLGFVLSAVGMLCLSLPFYVCATAATPIGAALLAKGLDPGAVLVFLLAGPASNMATILVLRRLLGRTAMFFYIVGIAAVAFTAGALLHSFYSTSSNAELLSLHAEHGSTLEMFFGLALLIVLLASFVRRAGTKPQRAGAAIGSHLG